MLHALPLFINNEIFPHASQSFKFKEQTLIFKFKNKNGIIKTQAATLHLKCKAIILIEEFTR